MYVICIHIGGKIQNQYTLSDGLVEYFVSAVVSDGIALFPLH